MNWVTINKSMRSECPVLDTHTRDFACTFEATYTLGATRRTGIAQT
jgi:hypothetical protein